VERNRKTGQNPPTVVAPIEEEEEDLLKEISRNENSSKIKVRTFDMGKLYYT